MLALPLQSILTMLPIEVLPDPFLSPDLRRFICPTKTFALARCLSHDMGTVHFDVGVAFIGIEGNPLRQGLPIERITYGSPPLPPTQTVLAGLVSLVQFPDQPTHARLADTRSAGVS